MNREFLVQTINDSAELKNYKLLFSKEEVQISVDKFKNGEGFGRIGVIDGFQNRADEPVLSPTISNLRIGRKMYGRTSEFDFSDEIFAIYERNDEPS